MPVPMTVALAASLAVAEMVKGFSPLARVRV
jgi:hypothetical protein